MEIPKDRLASYAHKDWLQTALNNWELSKLFDDSPEQQPQKPSSKRVLAEPTVQLAQLENVVADAEKIAVKQMRMSKGNGVESSTVLAKEHVQAWFHDFHTEGTQGNIGLVPEPLRKTYPKNAAPTLEPNTLMHVEHFCAWFMRRQ